MRINTKLLPIIMFTTLLLIGCAVKKARSGKGDSKDIRQISEQKFSRTQMDNLKSSTTLFLIRDQDSANYIKWQDALNEVWDINTIKVIYYDELDDYKGGNYSYFIMGGYASKITPSQGFTTYLPHLFLSLKFYPEGAERPTNYCRIDLFANRSTLFKLANEEDDYDLHEDLYTSETIIGNWTPGMMQLYLKDELNHLKKSQREFAYEENKNESELLRMHGEILYAPNYVLVREGEYKSKRSKQSKIFKKYPYNYELIDPNELSDLILKKEVKYILDYHNANRESFVKVYSLDKGRIYQNYKSGYNILTKRDLKILGKD